MDRYKNNIARISQQRYKKYRKQGLSTTEAMEQLNTVFISADEVTEAMVQLNTAFKSADLSIHDDSEDSKSTISNSSSSSSGSESPPPLISSPSDTSTNRKDGDDQATEALIMQLITADLNDAISDDDDMPDLMPELDSEQESRSYEATISSSSSGSESPPPISSPSDTSTNCKDCTDHDDLNDAISDDDDMPELDSEQESRSYEATMSNRSSDGSESSPISSPISSPSYCDETKSNEDDGKRHRRGRCRKMNGKRYNGGYNNFRERERYQQRNRDKRHERQQRKKNSCNNYCNDCKCTKDLCRGISSGCANQKHSRW